MIASDPELVRREYADESRLGVRAALWRQATGPDAQQMALEAVAEVSPRRVLEVGPGRGELAERIMRELGACVRAVDRSERMVELTRARGVDAITGNVQALPFPDRSFDCAVAAWVLYHVPDVSRALAELARVLRPGGRLVAVTNGERHLHELWGLCNGHARPGLSFSAENADGCLLRHFTLVERRDARGTVTFPEREAARRYVAASPTRAHLADELPVDGWPLVATRHAAVFAAEP